MSRIITDLSSEFARTGRHHVRFLTPEIATAARIARKYRQQMADGINYVDSRTPWIISDVGSVTLAATAKALYPAAAFPVLGGQYWWAGKAVRIRMFGRITTVLTPGNGSFDIYWGTGADANGTILASSAALALSASQTNLAWDLDITIRCRTTGATGSLFCRGQWGANVGVLASSLQPAMIPASAPAAVTVDTTAANIISVQFKRTGSTAETMQVHEIEVMALN